MPARSFTSFDEAAAISRLYGGLHFPFGNQNGLLHGCGLRQVILDRLRFTK